MKVLVTGGAGFIGSHVSKKLLDLKHEVLVIDNFNDNYDLTRKKANIKILEEYQSFTLEEKDISNFSETSEILKKYQPEKVIHLAALGNVRRSIHEPLKYVQNNIVGTSNMLEISKDLDVKNFVFASTSSVYGQRENVPFFEHESTDKPLAPYPASKKAGEVMGYSYHNSFGLNFTALRFFNVYGPQGRPDMMPFIIAEAFKNDSLITLFDSGKLRRDWTYIDDIVSGVIAAFEKNQSYEIINLGRGEPHSLIDFIEIMEKLSGNKLRTKNVEAPKTEPFQTYANIEKAKELLNYNPKTSLAQGLSNFWDWHREI